ncbi:MAG: tryptophan-rich sensory protein [Bacteroidetes bacterium]|nr:tryptophan-rich sensory protein [Bacteroidota bacterium]MDA0903793.1 tryptophan-rich sensory protein [Bacteroidota bacterium]MDA1242527.1 tryptophan-rich sensory protein [Bacteroidota bacterium]
MKSFGLVALLFGILNFAGLGLGGVFTGPGVQSNWYAELPQAPWTPPGWVFGAAWTTVMVGLSLFMAGAWTSHGQRIKVTRTFVLSWVLNVAWNPVFFLWHQVWLALAVILALFVVVVSLAIQTAPPRSPKLPRTQLWWRWCIAPYVVWLLIATSLNAYSAMA